MPTESDADDAAAFTSALARLKREGSNLLVVGTGEHAHAAVCHRLFGDDSQPRQRTYVSAGPSTSGPPTDATRISYTTTSRSAAAANPAPASPEDDIDTLAALRSAIANAVAAADRAAGGLAAAEFRLCLDSLYPLLEAHSQRELFRFLRAVTNEVAAVDGMAHYHLPLAYRDEPVQTVAPLFDGVVEVRVGPEGPQQRWYVADIDGPTGWLPVDPV
ncbi:hypothetical protein [Halosegnis sp.]|uniref:DUF7504 family protein n=1 Tax=Halosegnis sp. TaxID=2864959 RepID=UPI0035D493C2